MNYSVILLIAAAIIVFELVHEITNLFFKILFLVAKVLIVLLEYVALYQMWVENGLFVKILVPVSFIGFLILQIMLFRKCEEKSRLRKALISSMIIGTPILSYTTTFFLAYLFKIKVKTVLDMVDSIPEIFGIKKVL